MTFNVTIKFDDEAHARTYTQYLRGCGHYSTADQIEAQLPKPKPPEPKGRHAVVEDARGDLWVRVWTTGGNYAWARAGDPGTLRGWHRIDGVEVLSEGVEP